MVEYFKMAEVPDKQYFRCNKYSATLSTEACADMWRKANHEGSEAQFKCRVCPLGAVHAGETAASLSPLKGTTICGRCHRVAPRLIRGHLCVSCYNRSREIKLGKNAKGTAPVKLRPLHKRTVWARFGKEAKVIKLESAATDEVIVAALRDSRNRVSFAFFGMSPRINQLRLF